MQKSATVKLKNRDIFIICRREGFEAKKRKPCPEAKLPLKAVFLQSRLCGFNKRGECSRVRNGDLGKHFSVELNARLFEAVHKG